MLGISPWEKSDPVKFVNTVYEWLDKNYRNKNFVLVAVADRKTYFAHKAEFIMLEKANLKVRTIRKFGIQKYNNVSTDVFGWWRILSEFYGKKNYMYFFRLTGVRIERVYRAVVKRMCRVFRKGKLK